MTTSTAGAAPAATDPRPLLLRAVDQALDVAALVRPADLDRPTPCSDYDVRNLLGHVLGVLGRIAHVGRGGRPFDVPSIVLDVTDHDLPGALAAAAVEVREVWADDALLDRVLHLPFGDVPGRGAALAYVNELTAHAWDLAAALDRREVLDDALAVAALDSATRFIPDVARGEIPFGTVVPVPDDASPYDRLAGWLGRDPGFAPAG